MEHYSIKNINKKEVWEKFLLSLKPQSFLQSWNWGEVNLATGEKIFRLGIYDGSKLVGIALIVKQKAKRGPHLLIPAGPIIDWKNKKLVRYFFAEIRKLALKEGVWFVRIRPELLAVDDNKALFSKLGMVSSPMHLYAENTWILDLGKSENELLAEMRKSTRYLIKKSQSAGLTLVKSADKKNAKILFDLQRETAERHKFVGFPLKLFESEIEIFGKTGDAINFIVKKNSKVLASAIIIFYGESAYYHYSASTSKNLEIPFSYFLQWEVIKEAKRRGLKYYNFWGIAPSGSTNHRFAGVTLFKKGFGGYAVDWLHAYDLVISPLYYLTYYFELLRKVVRRL